MDDCLRPLYIAIPQGQFLRDAPHCFVSYHHQTSCCCLPAHCCSRPASYGQTRCANIGWELAYGVFYPLPYIETATFLLWAVIDLGIAHATVKFSLAQWRHAPLVGRNLAVIMSIGCVVSLVVHCEFIKRNASPTEAAFWSGFACQNLLGVLSVGQIVSRANTSGHSRIIWYVIFYEISRSCILTCTHILGCADGWVRHWLRSCSHGGTITTRPAIPTSAARWLCSCLFSCSW